MTTLTADDVTAIVRTDLNEVFKRRPSAVYLKPLSKITAKLSFAKLTGALVHHTVTFAIRFVEKDIRRIQSCAVSFQGLEANLTAEMIVSGSVLRDGLGEELERMQVQLASAADELTPAIASLREFNPDSRLALVLERLLLSNQELCDSVGSFLAHARGFGASQQAKTWPEQVAHARASFLAFAAAPISLESDVDEEIRTLLSEAVARQTASNYGEPSEVAADLSRSRLH